MENGAKIKINADFTEANKESDRFVSRLEKKLAQVNSQTLGKKTEMPFGIDAKTIQQVQKFAEQLKQINTIKPKIKVDVEMQKAQADIKRFAENSKKLEQDLTRQVAKEAEAQYQARTKQWMRGLQEFEKVLNKQNSAVKESSSLFSSFFGAAFFGNLAGNLVTNFLSSLSQLPEKARQIWDEAIKISSERQNALAGLDSIATFKGISSNEAKNAIQNLRLVKAGILDLADASTGLKNLLASGFDLKQSIDILERFSDSAAYGKQSALTFGEAISRAAEGIKNQNSNLVDNVGLTKNLSAILKERGFELEDLSNKQKSQNALVALYNGIMTETTAQVGDADKITNSYTGSTAALDAAYTNLLKTFGDYTTQSQDVVLANRIMTEQIDGYTKSVGDANSETGQFVRDAVKNYAYLKAQIIPFLDFASNSVKLVINELALFGTGALGIVAKVVEAIPNFVIDAVNKVKSVVAQIPTGILPVELQALANLPDLQKLTTGDTLLAQYEGFLKNVEINLKGINKALEEGARVNSLFNNQRPNVSTATGSLGIPNKNNSTGGSGSDAKSGRSRLADAGLDEYATNRQKALYNQALSNLPSQLKRQIEDASNQYKIPLKLALAQIFSESSFDPKAKSPFNKNVGDYAYGLTQQLPATASKVLKRKVTGKELQKNTGLALSAWGEYMDYLFNRYGDWELATLAYHQGEGTVDKLVKILDSGKSATGFFKARPKGKAYVGKIAALSGIRGDEQFKRGEPTLPNLVAAQPGEINKDLISVRELDAQSKFILGLYEAQNIKERSQTLNDRQLNFESEINAKIEDYNLSLKEQMQDLQVEQEFLKARDKYAEAQVEYQKQYNAQVREIGDIERDLLVFKAQNLDDQFVEQRRLLAAKREELDLQKDITNLQDQLANQGVNDSLKIQAAHLRDILNLREQELDAVISINRSQLELANSSQLSANQIQANVLEHLAGQKNINQSISDGIISAYDKSLEYLNKKLGKLGDIPILGDLAKFGNSQFLTKLTTGLMGLFPNFKQFSETKTDNPIAKPIVTEQKRTNDLLDKIYDVFTRPLAIGGGGIGGGGGTGGSGGVGGLNSIADIANFARGGFGGNNLANYGTRTGDTLDGVMQVFAGDKGRQDLWSNAKNFFSGKKGGIFGEEGFGNNVGTYSAIGGFAQL
ncbi:MAG TPA: transglycosylase SLT domain-containing protein, partial [Pyrinomonadaceae bacterium]|nr:transglycosylase SLT domain-containing protein [Pyrinomonadaceae bacterium]